MAVKNETIYVGVSRLRYVYAVNWFEWFTFKKKYTFLFIS